MVGPDSCSCCSDPVDPCGSYFASDIWAVLQAFGPEIGLLFFRERYRAERERKESQADGRHDKSQQSAAFKGAVQKE